MGWGGCWSQDERRGRAKGMKEGFRCEMGYLQQQPVGMSLRWGKERAFPHHSLRGWRHASTSPLSLRSFATKSQIQVFLLFFGIRPPP